MNYQFSFAPVFENYDLLLAGTWVTIQGAPDDAPRAACDRRRRKRAAVDDLRGCRYDLEV